MARFLDNNNQYKEKNMLVIIIDVSIMIMLLLYFMAFLGQGSEYLFIVGLLFVFRMYVKNSPIIIKWQLVLLALTFFLFEILYINYFKSFVLTTFIQQTLGVILMYIVGYYLVGNYTARAEKLIYIIALGFFVHGFLNLITNNFSDIGRNPIDFWNKNLIAATLQNTFFTISMAIFPCTILARSSILKKMVALIIAFIGIYNGIVTETRTGLYLFGLVCAFMILFWLVENRHNKFITNTFVLLIIIAIIVFIIIYANNLFNIKTIILNSFLFDRTGENGILSDPRFVRWRLTLENIFYYPFGGEELRNLAGGYAHNLWLDMMQLTGIIPAMLLVIYTICSLKYTFVVAYCKRIPRFTRYLILSTTIAILINCCIEAVLEGNLPFVLSLILINGITRRVYDNYIKNNRFISKNINENRILS